MFRHIVLLKLKPEATADERETLQRAIDDLPLVAPEIRGLRRGENVGSAPDNYDLAVIMDFDDEASFRSYLAGPAYHAYVSGPALIVERLAALQHLS